ncbi:hypothetical protein D3C73_1423410 [compost metagenome]
MLTQAAIITVAVRRKARGVRRSIPSSCCSRRFINGVVTASGTINSSSPAAVAMAYSPSAVLPSKAPISR